MKAKNDLAAEILQNAGLKCTSGRLALVRLLLETKNPLTQQEISEQLAGVEFNYVSIYRSLDAFVKAGIVHRIDAGDRTWRFALCPCDNTGHCHPHFICKMCGSTECLEQMKIPELSAAGLIPGYKIEEQEYYLKGICSRCVLLECPSGG